MDIQKNKTVWEEGGLCKHATDHHATSSCGVAYRTTVKLVKPVLASSLPRAQ